MHKLFKTALFVLAVLVIAAIAPAMGLNAAAEDDPLEIAVSATDKTYNGSAASVTPVFTSGAATIDPEDLEGTVTYTYYLASDTSKESPLAGAPVDAGSYVVVVSYHDDTAPYDYVDAEGEDTFTINKRAISLTATAYPVYGSDPDWDMTLNSGSFASGESYDDLDIDTSVVDALINAGTYNRDTTAIGNSNYNATNIHWLLVISKKTINVNIQPVNVTYGTSFTLSSAGSSFAYSDDIDALNITYKVDGVNFDDSDLSVYGYGTHALTATSGNTNYTVSFTGNTLAVAKFSVELTVSGSMVYGTAVTNQDNYTLEELKSILPFDQTYEDLGISYYVDTVKPSVGGSYRIRSSVTNSNYTIDMDEAYLEVTPLPINVTIDDKDAVYGNAVTYTITVDEGYAYASGDSQSSLQAVFTMDGTNVGEYEITAVFNSDNYDVSFTAGTMTITSRGITVAINIAGSIYGEEKIIQYTIPYLPYSERLADLNIEVLTPETEVGSYDAEISYDNVNYDITFTGGGYTISKKSVYVAINDVAIIYGEEPVYTIKSCSPLAYEDTVEELNITYSPESLDCGTHRIICEAENDNYDVIFNNVDDATIVISKRPITVVIEDVTVTYGINPIFSWHLQSGSTLAEWDIENDLNIECYTRSGLNVTEAPMPISHTFNNDNYAITFIDGLHRVNPKEITLQVKDVTKQYGLERTFDDDDLEIISGGLASLDQSLTALNLTFSCSGTVVGSYPLILTANNSNYSVTIYDGTLTITKRKVHIEVEDIVKAYGDKDSVIAYTSDVEGISFIGELDRERGETPGVYAITLGTLSAGDNYELILDDATLTIDDSKPPIAYAGLGVLGIGILGVVFMVIRKLKGAVIA